MSKKIVRKLKKAAKKVKQLNKEVRENYIAVTILATTLFWVAIWLLCIDQRCH